MRTLNAVADFSPMTSVITDNMTAVAVIGAFAASAAIGVSVGTVKTAGPKLFRYVWSFIR
jgi:hypothetical protein